MKKINDTTTFENLQVGEMFLYRNYHCIKVGLWENGVYKVDAIDLTTGKLFDVVHPSELVTRVTANFTIAKRK